MTIALPPRRNVTPFVVDGEVVDTRPHLIGRVIDPPQPPAVQPTREVLTVVVTDDAGNSPAQAAAEVWADWHALYPDAVIDVVHARPGEIIRAAGRTYWRDSELVVPKTEAT